MMKSFQIIITVVLGSIYTNGEVGGICKSDADCVQGFCSNEVCNCTRIHYGTDLFPYCQEVYPKMKCFRDDDCMFNGNCIDNACQCNEGYLRIRHSCREAIYQGLMEPCGREVGAKIEICDISKHVVCMSQICLCSHGFIPNSDGLCESRTSYLSLNNLTEYRVKPGVYCRSDKECLEGLKCKDLKCSCPSECKYDHKREVCDCGDVGAPIGPIIVGCIVGPLIIGFWSYMIGRTVKVYKFKKWFYHIPDHLLMSSSNRPPGNRAETTADASASIGLNNESSPTNHENGSRLPEANNNPNLEPHLSNPIHPTVDSPPSYAELDPPPPPYHKVADVMSTTLATKL